MMVYVAFLRAINVGGHTVKMDHLRALFTEMGFDKVSSFIASGNVIFESYSQDPSALETQIEAKLLAALGYEVKTFLRTVAEVTAAAAPDAEILAGTEADSVTLYVGFMHEPLTAEGEAKLAALCSPVDTLFARGRELYWRCSVPSVDSKVSGAALEKTLKQAVTLRNITTVRNLAAKYGSG